MYLLELLREVPDQRGKQGRQFPLAETLFMVILGACCGYTSYRKLQEFIECKWDIFRTFLKLKRVKPPKYNGLREIIISVKNEDLETVFRKHSFNLVDIATVKHIASDGKTIKGSRDTKNDNPAVQFLNLFAVNEKLILAHELIDNKTNEIPVFQKLIEELKLENKLFTADAIHCQKKL